MRACWRSMTRFIFEHEPLNMNFWTLNMNLEHWHNTHTASAFAWFAVLDCWHDLVWCELNDLIWPLTLWVSLYSILMCTFPPALLMIENSKTARKTFEFRLEGGNNGPLDARSHTLRFGQWKSRTLRCDNYLRMATLRKLWFPLMLNGCSCPSHKQTKTRKGPFCRETQCISEDNIVIQWYTVGRCKGKCALSGTTPASHKKRQCTFRLANCWYAIRIYF